MKNDSRLRRRKEDFGNRVSAQERLLAALLAVLLLVCAYDILSSGQARFVERVGSFRRLFGDVSPVVAVLSGWSVFWLFMVLSILAFTALTYVVDHYDRRWNARFYVWLRRIMLGSSVLVFLLFMVSAYLEVWSR